MYYTDITQLNNTGQLSSSLESSKFFILHYSCECSAQHVIVNPGNAKRLHEEVFSPKKGQKVTDISHDPTTLSSNQGLRG